MKRKDKLPEEIFIMEDSSISEEMGSPFYLANKKLEDLVRYTPGIIGKYKLVEQKTYYYEKVLIVEKKNMQL